MAVGTRFFASEIGRIVEENIQKFSTYYSDVEVLNYVVMPNHLHLVLALRTLEAKSDESTMQLGCLKQREHEVHRTQDFHHNCRLASVI